MRHEGQRVILWCSKHDSQIPDALAMPYKFWPCFKMLVRQPEGPEWTCEIEDPATHWVDI